MWDRLKINYKADTHWNEGDVFTVFLNILNHCCSSPQHFIPSSTTLQQSLTQNL